MLQTSEAMTGTEQRKVPMTKPLPPPELLRKLLRYEPETGKLFWRERPVDMFPSERACKSWNTRWAGKEAFTAVGKWMYRVGRLQSKGFRAHRIAWTIHYGKWPEGHIDHINGDRGDNSLDNLRDVSRCENMRNSKIPSTNKSGVLGVYWDKVNSLWRASISVEGKTLNLGRYASISEAAEVRRLANIKYGYHKNHGGR